MRPIARIAPALLALFLASCAAADGPDPGDDEAPLGDYDAILGGAPGNDTLPDENKADAVYPKQSTELIATQSAVKSQGSRGVCSIFSTVALMEHLYLKSDRPLDFSEQYLQWSVKNEVGAFRNTSGSNAQENLEAICDYGIPEEAAWPYESFAWGPANDPGCTGEESMMPVVCFTNGDPPQGAIDAPKFKLPCGRWLNTNSIKAHVTTKKQGVIVGVDFFYQSWNHRRSTLPTNPESWRKGYVLAPNAKDVEESHKQRAGHSILIVGWDDDLEVQKVDPEGKPVVDAAGNAVMEKGFWLFKNSWGTAGFGIDNPNGAGYGWLSYDYVRRYGSATVSDVPALDPVDPPPAGEHYQAAPGSAIPDDDAAGVSSTINVPTSGGLAEVSVTVDITHTYVGDLLVTVSHGGQTVTLHEHTGGTDDDLRKTFPVPSLAGAERGGEWTLRVTDTYAQDVGTLNSWALDLR